MCSIKQIPVRAECIRSLLYVFTLHLYNLIFIFVLFLTGIKSFEPHLGFKYCMNLMLIRKALSCMLVGFIF